ncbi:MAG: hypothetical protein ACRD1K_03855 [Acidimicrobiales bacterium]
MYNTHMAPAARWNGYRVWLSSPRHRSSGSRGECRNPGWEENINGRFWNWHAAVGDYYAEQYDPTSGYRNLAARGYQVVYGANAKDDNCLANRTNSNNWGANVHLVTHTNAGSTACENPAKYTLTMFKSGDSIGQNLALRTAINIDNVAPGGRNTWCAGTGCPSGSLAELSALAAWRTYVEVIFHTNQVSQTWFPRCCVDAKYYTWRYGPSVDNELGYPR